MPGHCVGSNQLLGIRHRREQPDDPVPSPSVFVCFLPSASLSLVPRLVSLCACLCLRLSLLPHHRPWFSSILIQMVTHRKRNLRPGICEGGSFFRSGAGCLRQPPKGRPALPSLTAPPRPVPSTGQVGGTHSKAMGSECTQFRLDLGFEAAFHLFSCSSSRCYGDQAPGSGRGLEWGSQLQDTHQNLFARSLLPWDSMRAVGACVLHQASLSSGTCLSILLPPQRQAGYRVSPSGREMPSAASPCLVLRFSQ